MTTAYPLLDDGTIRGPVHETPCEICGEGVVVRPNKRNEWQLTSGHVRGVHHRGYLVAERRIAEGWLPLSGALLAAYETILRVRERRLAGLSTKRPVEDFAVGYEVEGERSLGYVITPRGDKYVTAGARSELRWVRSFYAAAIVETAVLFEVPTTVSSAALRAHLARLERAALRTERHREPWWIAWQLSMQSDQAAIKTGLKLGLVHKLTNDPRGYRRGDLTP